MKYISLGIAMAVMSMIGISNLERSLEPFVASGDVSAGEVRIIAIAAFGGFLICVGMVAYGVLLQLSTQQTPISNWANRIIHINRWTYIEKITACLAYAAICIFLAWEVSSSILECTFCIKRTFYSEVVPDARMVIYTWSYLMVLGSLALSVPAGVLWVFFDRDGGGGEQ